MVASASHGRDRWLLRTNRVCARVGAGLVARGPPATGGGAQTVDHFR
jgi:hypothetical protein